MTKKKILGAIWFILILFSISFVYSTPNSSAWGDELLRKVGLRAWSKGSEGLHYTVIAALIIIILAYNRVIYYLKDIYPKFTRRLIAILIIFFIIYPGIYLNIHKVILAHSKGLNAIEYYRKESSIQFKNEEDNYIKLDGQIQFENMGDQLVKFNVKLIPDNFFRKDFYDKEYITVTKPDTEEIEEFIVYPHTKQIVPISFKVKTDKSLSNLNGIMTDLNIIIFDKDKEKAFIK
jgi:hypothetical protein